MAAGWAGGVRTAEVRESGAEEADRAESRARSPLKARTRYGTGAERQDGGACNELRQNEVRHEAQRPPRGARGLLQRRRGVTARREAHGGKQRDGDANGLLARASHPVPIGMHRRQDGEYDADESEGEASALGAPWRPSFDHRRDEQTPDWHRADYHACQAGVDPGLGDCDERERDGHPHDSQEEGTRQHRTSKRMAKLGKRGGWSAQRHESQQHCDRPDRHSDQRDRCGLERREGHLDEKERAAPRERDAQHQQPIEWTEGRAERNGGRAGRLFRRFH